DLRRLDDARQVGRTVQRNADGSSLTGERRENCLTNPPHRVGDELDALIGVEFPGGGEQANISLADEIDEGESTILVLFGDGDDEAEITLHQLLERVLITSANLTGEVDFLRSFEERISRHLV